ncbi:MAG: hypothetical protein U0670_21770 [Anaerolineae bacterium]
MSIRRCAALLLVVLVIFALPVFAPESTDEPVPETTAAPEPDKTDEPTPTALPRGDLDAYAWEDADLAVFVPMMEEPVASDEGQTLTAATDDGMIRYIVRDSTVEDGQLYDLLAEAMLSPDLGLALTTYEQTTIYGRLGWRVDGVNYTTGQLARGRVARLPDNRALITIALAADEPTLARRADAAAYGLAFGAAGIPEMPNDFPPDRLGAAALMLHVPVQGYLDETHPQQQWTYQGRAGEQVSFIAVDLARTYVFDLQLDMAIRVYNPDGTEFGFNDDQVGTDVFGAYDALLAEVTLPTDGEYVVQVEWVQGAGTYTLGVSGTQTLTINADGATRLNGQLSNVFTFDRYAFEAHQGESYTFTMMSTSGDLDPTLEITLEDGRSLAFNDDAEDTTLGTNAQLVTVLIPADGLYVLEAGRYSGTGAYEITITQNN